METSILDNTGLIITVVIAHFLGFWNIKDLLKSVFEIRDMANGTVSVTTTNKQYKSNDKDWDAINALKPKYEKMSVKKMTKLDLTGDEKIARDIVAKKKGKM